MKNIMYYLLFSHIQITKFVILIIIVVMAGELTTLIDVFNEHPALTSSVAGVLAAVAAKYADKWWTSKIKRTPTGDKVLDLEQQERKGIREENQKLIDDKENYWKFQNDRLKAELFEVSSRHRAERSETNQINHAAINEIMRLHNVILGMQRTLVLQNLPVPEVSVLEITKFLLPVWEKERTTQENEYNNDKTEPAKP